MNKFEKKNSFFLWVNSLLWFPSLLLLIQSNKTQFLSFSSLCLYKMNKLQITGNNQDYFSISQMLWTPIKLRFFTVKNGLFWNPGVGTISFFVKITIRCFLPFSLYYLLLHYSIVSETIWVRGMLSFLSTPSSCSLQKNQGTGLHYSSRK